MFQSLNTTAVGDEELSLSLQEVASHDVGMGHPWSACRLDGEISRVKSGGSNPLKSQRIKAILQGRRPLYHLRRGGQSACWPCGRLQEVALR